MKPAYLGFARPDANQKRIADALRLIGAVVKDLSRVGGGTPDLLVGYKGLTVLLEVKREPGKQGGTSGANLSKTQSRWHLLWCGGPCHLVRTVDEAIEIVRLEAARLRPLPKADLRDVVGGDRERDRGDGDGGDDPPGHGEDA